MNKLSIDSLRVEAGKAVDLSCIDTTEIYGLDEKHVKRELKKIYKSILSLQEKLYAGKEQSLLIVLQAMDAAGKDSTIRKLTTRLNVQGARVQSFGKPSKKELAHDFLWRAHRIMLCPKRESWYCLIDPTMKTY